jgi:hypothetical protein
MKKSDHRQCELSDGRGGEGRFTNIPGVGRVGRVGRVGV